MVTHSHLIKQYFIKYNVCLKFQMLFMWGENYSNKIFKIYVTCFPIWTPLL